VTPCARNEDGAATENGDIVYQHQICFSKPTTVPSHHRNGTVTFEQKKIRLKLE
jgi:hypothetical protein